MHPNAHTHISHFAQPISKSLDQAKLTLLGRELFSSMTNLGHATEVSPLLYVAKKFIFFSQLSCCKRPDSAALDRAILEDAVPEGTSLKPVMVPCSLLPISIADGKQPFLTDCSTFQQHLWGIQAPTDLCR